MTLLEEDFGIGLIGLITMFLKSDAALELERAVRNAV
jgi:hypothetical protein